jgi:hypothetical protein
MASESGSSASSNPLQAVADAMDAAAKAAKEGVEEARATAADTLPVANEFLSRLAYKTCYTISYGVVFPTVLIARSIPPNNALMNGLVDGAQAAIDMVQEMRNKSEPGASAEGAPAGPSE